MNGPRSHARERAAILGEVIERVLFDLRRAGADGAARDALERALVEIAAWASPSGTSEEHLAHLERATGAVESARAAIADPRAAASISEVAGSLHRARAATIDAVVSAQDAELRATGPTAAGPAPPFLASVGVPALHRSPAAARFAVEALGARAPLAAADDDGPAPRTLDDLARIAARDEDREAAEAALPAAPIAARTPEQLHLDLLARDCLEDLGALGLLRRPHPQGDWLAAERFERRLLANLDALVALGTRERGASAIIDVVERAAAYARENTYGDNARAFALSFLLGCFEGDLAARAAVSAMRRAHPAALPGHAAALRLASGDGVGRATETLLLDSRAELVEIALEILTGRREAAFAAVVAHLSHPSSRIVAAAARCLATVGEREAAIGALTELVDGADDDRVFLAAAEALAVLGASAGVVALRERLALEADTRGLESDAFVERGVALLATVGAASDGALVRALATRGARHRRALGWFGDPAHVDALLADLAMQVSLRGAEQYPSPAEVATVEALHRIIGAELRVAPDAVPPTEVTTDLVRDPHAWADAWVSVRDALPRGARVRFGRPWSPLIVIDELASAGRASDRAHASRELAIASGGASRLDVDGWVEAQLRELARLRTAFDRGAWPLHAGTWPGDH